MILVVIDPILYKRSLQWMTGHQEEKKGTDGKDMLDHFHKCAAMPATGYFHDPEVPKPYFRMTTYTRSLIYIL